jgi:hypothetical protein
LNGTYCGASRPKTPKRRMKITGSPMSKVPLLGAA